MLVYLLVACLGLSGSVALAEGPPTTDYLVTIKNLASGQPLSPPVAATHKIPVRMFKVGAPASPELEAIAEDGNQAPMFDLLTAAGFVTEAVDVGMPLTPFMTSVGDFTDSASFMIGAGPGDRLSLATMLICTNDGFTGLDRAKLPVRGSEIFWTNGYDAGTEDNTEMSQDIVDPCSALGPVPLVGDPNGNENDAVDTDPQMVIRHHPNIEGNWDLSIDEHTWIDPVARVTVTRIGGDAMRFETELSGAAENPPVETDASGRAKLRLNRSESALHYKVNVLNIEPVAAHIHLGMPAMNGPVVAPLFMQGDRVRGTLLAKGTIREADLVGPLADDFAAFLEALRTGKLYVNVHTPANPPGEIRGQIGAAP
jgi:hypothetical protein